MQSKRIGILPEFVPWGAPKGEVHRGGTAGLGARIVKFRCLADDDRAGAQDQDFFDIRILGHQSFTSIILRKRSNRYKYRL